MALASGITWEIPASELPAGASAPVVAEISGAYNTEMYTGWLSPATDFDNANELTGLAAVIAGIETALDAYIQTPPIAVSTDDTVEARYVVTFIRRGHPTFTQGEYSKQYVASVEGYQYTARIEWKVTPAA